MPVLTIDMLLACLVAGLGVASGWWLCCLTSRRRPVVYETATAVAPPGAAPPADVSGQILAQLHDIADRMAADVGQHSSRMRQISTELTQTEEQDKNGILAALTKLLEANERMQQQLQQSEHRLQQQERQIESYAAAARTDALTGLPNRRAFDDEMARAEQAFVEEGRPVSVLVMDIDHFKKFNDTYGHYAGDAVLRSVGRVLRQMTGRDEVPARYGGEEFAVIFHGRPAADVAAQAEQLRAAIAATPVPWEDQQLQVTASAGLAQLLQGEKSEQLFQRADTALYASKNAGRNCGHLNDGTTNRPLVASSAKSPAADETRREPDVPEPAAQARAVEASSRSAPRAESPNRSAARPATSAVDPETGLPSRAALLSHLEGQLSRAHRDDAHPILMLVKIDQYRRLVNGRGEQVGRLVLGATKQFLRALMSEKDYVARFDRDTLALILPDGTVEQAIQVGQRLRAAIERCRLQADGGQVHFTISVGLAQARKLESKEDLLARSHLALEAAFACGNCCYYHDGEDWLAAETLQLPTGVSP